MAVGITWEGLDELKFALRNAPQMVEHVLPMALSEEAQVIFARSQVIVPVRTGVLRSSGHVDPVRTDNHGVFVTLGYGGPSATYAGWVHESYSKHTPPTQRKYLETPIKTRAPYLQRNIAIRINDILRNMFRSGK